MSKAINAGDLRTGQALIVLEQRLRGSADRSYTLVDGELVRRETSEPDLLNDPWLDDDAWRTD